MTIQAALELENFGPILKGKVEFKPLTILIGQNNTGKSYTTMCYYAVMRVLNTFLIQLSGGAIVHLWSVKYIRRLSKVKKIETLVKLYTELFMEAFKDLEKSFTEDRIIREIERTFSCRVHELILYGEDKANMKFSVLYGPLALNTNLNLNIYSNGSVDSKLNVRIEQDKIRNILEHVRKMKLEMPLSHLIHEILSKAKILSIHYLPASRAGILHAYKTIAQALITSAPYVPIRGVEIPRVSGVFADFLSELMGMQASITEKEVSKDFEKNVLEGSVELVKAKEIIETTPEIIYVPREGYSIPIARVSSMISELSPLDLFIKYGVVKRGDTVIIEEPEAHLHPDAQAKLARIFAKLINELNLNLIITTHSDILLAKLSNLISLNALPDNELRSRGYTRSETLKPEQVSVYFFRKTSEGVVIEPIKVTYEGISDYTFREIIEELYNETMDLHYRIQELKQK